MPSGKISSILMPLLTIFCLYSTAQTTAEQKKADEFAQLKNRVVSKRFSFIASNATTQRGKTIQLTSEYSLKMNTDSLMVDLPYYGRSYANSFNSTESPLRFNTNAFSYTADTAKKGGWNITIIPKNNSGVSKIFLYINPDGYCTARVNSNSRDMISFYGVIQPFHP